MRRAPNFRGTTVRSGVRACLLALALSGCGGRVQSSLNPKGPISSYIATWWWLLFAVASAVVLLIIVLVLVAVLRRHRGQSERKQTHRDGAGSAAEVVPQPNPEGERRLMWFVGLMGVAFPTVVLSTLMGFNIYTEHVLETKAEAPNLVIEVVGQRWWWQVRYPELGITAANEIHIPAGRPVQIKVTSGDVIHSFWVPQLNGKIDTIPGQTNTISIQADAPGAFRGQCGEYCGLQHAKMAFWVVADAPDDFAAWIAKEQQPAPEPTTPLVQQGQQVFLGSACVYCHAVKGTNASSQLGPDLTHLAGRRTIGAGILENNQGNLGGWIVNPQDVKPGNKMPPMYLNSDDLQALLAYLETLK